MYLSQHWGRVLLCILYIVCINIGISNTELVAKEVENESQPKVNVPLTFPSNISDTYKGTWIASNDTTLSTLEFEKRGGVVLFQILNRRSIVDGIDIVKGDLRIRDGVYSTDATLSYYLQGIYVWRSGGLILIANPMEEEPLIEDFVLEIGRNSNVIDALQKANMAALSKLDNRTSINGKPRCYWSMLLQASPVSQDFNERYAHLYTNPIQESEGGEEFQRPTLLLSGTIFSPNCNLTASMEVSSLELDTYYSKATNYVVMVAISSFIQIILLIRQMDYTNTQTSASKVSLLMIGAQAMMDSYLCLLHLTGGIIVETVFNAFATAAFFQFIGFSVFEMRYLFTIWKARNPQAFTELRREFGMLYARFYGCLLLGFLFIYYIEGAMTLFIILMYSFLVPQIVCNAQRGTNKALTKPYAIGSVVTRALIPMYFYGCPYNFVHSEPHYLFLSYLLAWLGLQLTVLFLQDYMGPRFFIPRQFLPPKYNYQRSYRGTEEPECVICMSPVDVNSRDFMQTPCDHMFHEHCLLQWLDQKMECPTCRRALPTV